MARVFALGIGGLLAVDFAALAGLGWEVGWWVALTEAFATGILGLLVIVYASWRYGNAIAVRFNGDDAIDDRLLTGLMLAVAGALLLLPGLITDLSGLVLLIPGVRRCGVRALQSRVAGREDSSQATPRCG
jgi:UPF0716 protein FxsA